MTEARPLGAEAWQRSVAEQWVRDATANGSPRYSLLDQLSASVEELVAGSIGNPNAARSVIRELSDTLRHCDRLPFEEEAQCLAYICWHLVDRYGRTQQALDALFVGGHLPLRRAGVAMLEVGSGPAPAVYAAIDYYRHLAEWCASIEEQRQVVGLRRADTLDRGIGWGPLIHRLSELRLPGHGGESREALRSLPFNTTYSNLRSFSVRRLHDGDRLQAALRLQEEADQADEYLDLSVARQMVQQPLVGIPSAYDLIVMCNFLTNIDFTVAFTAELSELAHSLTPGGILLILGAVGGDYPQVYSQLDRLVTGPGSPRLKLILADNTQAHVNPVTSRRVATQVIRTLSHLERFDPAAFDAVRHGLSPDVRRLDADQVKFPAFTMRAYKREGPASVSRREKRRQDRRRGGNSAA